MKQFDKPTLLELAKAYGAKPRLLRELRFVPDEVTHWDERELLAIATKDAASGVLAIELDDLFLLPFQIMHNPRDKTGRAKPITCDFCYTWQQGGKAARITFTRKSDNHTITHLCCGDLQCSLHVRNLTPTALLSRSQLHEDLNTDQRIARLRRKLHSLLVQLETS